MKYLIVGLGNIGEKYRFTRHNIGFEVLDALASASNLSFSPDRYGDIAELKHKGRTLVLLKPSTFMNLSGKAVRYWMEKEKIPVDRILIITDDLALPFGTIRLRAKGSDGGHNGLKSIQELIGTTKYPRLRFGIGDEYRRGHQVDYVLSQWSEKEAEKLGERIERCRLASLDFTTIGIARAMNEYNNT